jgi:hypothetical protein
MKFARRSRRRFSVDSFPLLPSTSEHDDLPGWSKWPVRPEAAGQEVPYPAKQQSVLPVLSKPGRRIGFPALQATMNTLNKISVTKGQHSSSTLTKIHRLGGLGMAGLFGGPLALSYLIYRDLVMLRRQDLLYTAALWCVPIILFWLYCIFSFPPDLISQWIVYLPQTILWWIVARHLLGKIHADYQQRGGPFLSRWRAVRFGILSWISFKILFFAADFVIDLLAG